MFFIHIINILKGVKTILNTLITFTKAVIFVCGLFNIAATKFKKIYIILDDIKNITKAIIAFITIIKYIYAAIEHRLKN